MRRYISILLFIMCFRLVNAQDLVIQPPIFAPFECTEFYKLYTGSISNFTNETFKTQLVIEVEYTSPAGVTSKLADGIITGNPSIDITPGMTIIDNATYESIYRNRKITFYNKEIESLLSRTKCLPPGQYDVCLTLYTAGSVGIGQEFLTQTCFTRDKEMLSQLLLVSPFEEEEVRVDLPLFTWTAVTPFNPEAMYRIQIVEILANQTPFHAFNANPVFFEKTGLKSNIMQYPVSARPLLPCRRYAWRVTYELNGGFGNPFSKAPDFLQESEIWEFSTPCEEEVDEPKVEKPQDNLSYFNLNEAKYNQIISLSEYELRLLIDHPYSQSQQFSYSILDGNSSILNATCCSDNGGLESSDDDARGRFKGEKAKNYGKNRFIFDLIELGLEEGKTYRMLIDDGKENKEIKFKIELK